MAYFKVKSFSIYDIDDHMDVMIDPLLKDFICSEKYYLNSIYDIHYDPRNFFEFLKLFSSKNPNKKYHVYYKYEYFNHDHINEYMNKMSLINSEIYDRLNG